jgi:hypothetical protein
VPQHLILHRALLSFHACNRQSKAQVYRFFSFPPYLGFYKLFGRKSILRWMTADLSECFLMSPRLSFGLINLTPRYLAYTTKRSSLTHSLPGATTHVGSWPTQVIASISVLGLAPPISYSQPFCIPHHSIHPSEVWPPHSPYTLRLMQGDFLTW